MTKGRKGSPAAKITALALRADAIQSDLTQAQALEDQRREILQDEAARRTEETIRLGMQMGALHFAQVQTTILRAAQIRLFDEIRKSKAYKDLPIKHPDGKVRPAQNIEEFCEVYLGQSYRKAHEESQLLASLGDSAFEAAKKLGLKRDLLRQIPGLPVDTQDSVKELLTSGATATEVATAVESVITRFLEARTKEDEAKQRLEQQLGVKDQLIRTKDEKINELAAQLAEKESLTLPQREKLMVDQLDAAGKQAEVSLRVLLDVAAEAVTGNYCDATATRARNFVSYLAQQMVDASDRHGIVYDLAETMQPITEAVIERATAATGVTGQAGTTASN